MNIMQFMIIVLEAITLYINATKIFWIPAVVSIVILVYIIYVINHDKD